MSFSEHFMWRVCLFLFHVCMQVFILPNTWCVLRIRMVLAAPRVFIFTALLLNVLGFLFFFTFRRVSYCTATSAAGWCVSDYLFNIFVSESALMWPCMRKGVCVSRALTFDILLPCCFVFHTLVCFFSFRVHIDLATILVLSRA